MKEISLGIVIKKETRPIYIITTDISSVYEFLPSWARLIAQHIIFLELQRTPTSAMGYYSYIHAAQRPKTHALKFNLGFL